MANNQGNSKPTILEMIISVLGAFFGVQSSKVRERDFNRGHAWWVYALVGVILCGIIIVSLILLVKFILMRHGL